MDNTIEKTMNRLPIVESLKRCAESPRVADRIYRDCEESHAVPGGGGSNLAGYEVLDVLLPNANRLSVSDYEALVDHLQEWRKEIGLPAAHL